MTTFSEMLADAVAASRLSPEQIASGAHISSDALTALMEGKATPAFVTLMELADLLGFDYGLAMNLLAKGTRTSTTETTSYHILRSATPGRYGVGSLALSPPSFNVLMRSVAHRNHYGDRIAYNDAENARLAMQGYREITSAWIPGAPPAIPETPPSTPLAVRA